jgi:hypothetical protein
MINKGQSKILTCFEEEIRLKMMVMMKQELRMLEKVQRNESLKVVKVKRL